MGDKSKAPPSNAVSDFNTPWKLASFGELEGIVALVGQSVDVDVQGNNLNNQVLCF